jgi:hypothetical protein
VGETLLSYDGPLVVGGALKFDHLLATLIGDWRDPAAAYYSTLTKSLLSSNGSEVMYPMYLPCAATGEESALTTC